MSWQDAGGPPIACSTAQSHLQEAHPLVTNTVLFNFQTGTPCWQQLCMAHIIAGGCVDISIDELFLTIMMLLTSYHLVVSLAQRSESLTECVRRSHSAF